jgi:putative exosortase-associated protein (TIGR04073 family)
MTKRRTILVASTVVIWFLTLTAHLALADDYRTVENAGPQEVVDAMATKAGRGLANTATGWVEFPKQIYITAKDDGIAKGLFVGPIKGLGMTLVRTVSGVLEVMTFFVPFPGFYDPYFDPAYVWKKE